MKMGSRKALGIVIAVLVVLASVSAVFLATAYAENDNYFTYVVSGTDTAEGYQPGDVIPAGSKVSVEMWAKSNRESAKLTTWQSMVLYDSAVLSINPRAEGAVTAGASFGGNLLVSSASAFDLEGVSLDAPYALTEASYFMAGSFLSAPIEIGDGVLLATLNFTVKEALELDEEGSFSAYVGNMPHGADPSPLGLNRDSFIVDQDDASDADKLSKPGSVTIENIAPHYAVSFLDAEDERVDMQIVAYGGTAAALETVPAAPAGYAFDYWALDGEPYDFEMPVTASIELKPIFKKLVYTVTFLDADGELFVSQSVAYEETATMPEETPDAPVGKSFAYWAQGETEYDFSTPVTENLVLTPVFEDAAYTVTFLDADGEIFATRSVMHGGSVTAPEAPAKAGEGLSVFQFAGWDQELENITGDLTVKPVYEALVQEILSAEWAAGYAVQSVNSYLYVVTTPFVESLTISNAVNALTATILDVSENADGNKVWTLTLRLGTVGSRNYFITPSVNGAAQPAGLYTLDTIVKAADDTTETGRADYSVYDVLSTEVFAMRESSYPADLWAAMLEAKAGVNTNLSKLDQAILDAQVAVYEAAVEALRQNQIVNPEDYILSAKWAADTVKGEYSYFEVLTKSDVTGIQVKYNGLNYSKLVSAIFIDADGNKVWTIGLRLGSVGLRIYDLIPEVGGAAVEQTYEFRVNSVASGDNGYGDYTGYNTYNTEVAELVQARYDAALWAEMLEAKAGVMTGLSQLRQDMIDEAVAAYRAAIDAVLASYSDKADYSKVDALIAEAGVLEASNYTAYSWTRLQNAIAAVDRSLTYEDQAAVDAVANAIETALKQLAVLNAEGKILSAQWAGDTVQNQASYFEVVTSADVQALQLTFGTTKYAPALVSKYTDLSGNVVWTFTLRVATLGTRDYTLTPQIDGVLVADAAYILKTVVVADGTTGSADYTAYNEAIRRYAEYDLKLYDATLANAAQAAMSALQSNVPARGLSAVQQDLIDLYVAQLNAALDALDEDGKQTEKEFGIDSIDLPETITNAYYNEMTVNLLNNDILPLDQRITAICIFNESGQKIGWGSFYPNEPKEEYAEEWANFDINAVEDWNSIKVLFKPGTVGENRKLTVKAYVGYDADTLNLEMIKTGAAAYETYELYIDVTA